MIFDVYIRREEGWILPLWRSCMKRPHRARVHIIEVRDDAGRPCRAAQLFDLDGVKALDVPVLYNPQFATSDGSYLSLVGVERITDPLSHREYEYGQIWELVLPDTGVGLASAD